MWVSRLPLPSKVKTTNPDMLTEAIMTNTVGQLLDVWRMWLVKETPAIPVVKRKGNNVSTMHSQIKISTIKNLFLVHDTNMHTDFVTHI